MKKLLVIVALCLSGCSASGYGLDGKVDAPPEGDRWTAWAQAVRAEYAARKPTLEIVQYREDGVTPAAKITMDLAPIIGKGAPAMPKGAVAEGIEAFGTGTTKIFNTPVGTLLGGAVLLGQATGDSHTEIHSSEGSATNIGSGTSGVSAVTEVVPEGVVAE